MPIKVLCNGCGFLLREADDLESIKQALRRNGGKCPYCGRSLEARPVRIEVKVLSPPKPLI